MFIKLIDRDGNERDINLKLCNYIATNMGNENEIRVKVKIGMDMFIFKGNEAEKILKWIERENLKNKSIRGILSAYYTKNGNKRDKLCTIKLKNIGLMIEMSPTKVYVRTECFPNMNISVIEEDLDVLRKYMEYEVAELENTKINSYLEL